MKNGLKPTQMIDRVRLMASGHGKWDLSPNDIESLLYLLDEHDRLTKKVMRLQAAERQGKARDE